MIPSAFSSLVGDNATPPEREANPALDERSLAAQRWKGVVHSEIGCRQERIWVVGITLRKGNLVRTLLSADQR